MSILGTIAGGLGLSALGNLLSPVTKGIGNLISGGTWQQSGQEIKSQEFNAQEAQKQRDWEQNMSNTAYQRSMGDLEAAGLNPNLIYGTGGAASTPGGASAHGNMAPPGANSSLVSNLATVINSASNLMNASTRQLASDRYSKHLDYKERDEIQETTNKIYDNAGKILGHFVSDSYRYRK